MTELRTCRLVLRPWTDSADDLAFLFDMYARVDVQRYIGATPRLMQSIDEARERVERWRGMHDGCRGVWAVTLHDGTRLGTVLCKRIPWSGGADDVEDTEIGWHLHPDAWGHGYATEAATAVARRAFTGFGTAAGLDRLVAVTNPANAASQRVCRRIGMTAEGPTDRYYDVTCELFTLTAPGRRCVAFFRNVNQGQRGHPSTAQLVEAMTDAGFTAASGFRANGTMVGDAVGPVTALAADTAAALAVCSGLERAVFVLPLDEVADIVDAAAPGDAPAERLELSVFDPHVAVADPPVRGIGCTVVASGAGWAVTLDDDDGFSQATPTIERLIGSPVTSRGLGTIRGLVARDA